MNSCIGTHQWQNVPQPIGASTEQVPTALDSDCRGWWRWIRAPVVPAARAAPALVPGEAGTCTVHEMCPSLEGLHCSAVPALASEHLPRGHGSPPSSSRALTPEPWPQLKPAVPDNNQGSGEMKAGRSRTPQQYLCHPPSIQADARTAPSRTGTDTTLCLIPACHCSCLKDIPKTLT